MWHRGDLLYGDAVSRPYDVAVIGGGFGGSLLARVVASRGLRVAVVERDRHPRFHIGESSTPLGNLSLERLASRYGLADLRELSSHGRWMRSHPELGRGLKRGFTFYQHRPGQPYANSTENDHRLLVGASPSDAVADTHWLRADVDLFWAECARGEGVEYFDGTTLVGAEEGRDVVRLVLSGPKGHPHELSARFAIDASGAAGALAQCMGVGDDLEGVLTQSRFVGTHFEGVLPFAEVASESVACMEPGPYDDDWAAVHHLLEEGWMYVLRFDDGRVSAGVLLDGDAPLGDDPAVVFASVLERYPTLGACFAGARSVERWLYSQRVQHRRERAVGRRWALLPHAYAFVDPLFSTGIAWTLLGIERLAELILDAAAEGEPSPSPSALSRYEALLSAEASGLDRLIAGAYLARRDFRLTAAHAQLYFAAVSWAETQQRLRPDATDHWSGFLGVGDAEMEGWPAQALKRIRTACATDGEAPSDADVEEFERWVGEAIAMRNVAGLSDSTKQNLYPADPQDLVRGASLLGLTPQQVQDLLPMILRL